MSWLGRGAGRDPRKHGISPPSKARRRNGYRLRVIRPTIPWPRRSKRPPSLLSLWMETLEGSRFRPLAVGSRRTGVAPGWLEPGGAVWKPASVVPLSIPTPSIQFQFPGQTRGWFWLGKFCMLLVRRGGIYSYNLSTAYIGSANFSVHRAGSPTGASSIDLVPLVFVGLVLAEWLQVRFFTTDSQLLFTKPGTSAVHSDARPGSVYRKHSGL